MLFHSSIRKELARSFGATLVVLFTIVLSVLFLFFSLDEFVHGNTSSFADDSSDMGFGDCIIDDSV